jgi:hypothetical protein
VVDRLGHNLLIDTVPSHHSTKAEVSSSYPSEGRGALGDGRPALASSHLYLVAKLLLMVRWGYAAT